MLKKNLRNITIDDFEFSPHTLDFKFEKSLFVLP
jgi:hypothetical protein